LTSATPLLHVMTSILKRLGCEDATGKLTGYVHKVLYLINAGYNDDLEAGKPTFTTKAETSGLFELLSKANSPPELKNLFQNTIGMYQ
jgi:hypothetical protein